MREATTIRGTLLVLLLIAACGDEDPARPCTTDSDCDLPQLCGSDGLCAAPDPAAEGAACLHDDHCKSELCFDRGEGGTCATACTQPADCTAGQVCLPVEGRPVADDANALKLLCQAKGSGVGHLGEACTADDGCTSGLCEDGRCTQVCGSCPGLLACEQTTLTRDKLSVTSGICKAGPPVRVIELGGVETNVTAASAVSFTIDPNVRSFLVFADDYDNLRVAITRLEAPDGTVLVDLPNFKTAPMRSWDYFGTASVQVPGTDDPKAAVQPGTYKVWVQTHEATFTELKPAAGKIERVAVIVRSSAQTGGLLDLDLHFSPGTGVTAATAASDPFVQGTLKQLDAEFAWPLGVAVGEVRYLDLPAAEDVMKSADDVRRVRVTYSQAGPNGISASIFIVQEMQFGYEALSGGLPGVPGLDGRPVSGIVARKQSSANKMGRLLAHELGHFFGLFHTSDSVAPDPISDTPACANPTQANAPNCPDFQYVMFPYHMLAPEPVQFSKGQALVVRGSPWFHETVYFEACGPGTEAVDLSRSLFASGSTALLSDSTAASDVLSASCGGAGQPERVHLLRLEQAGLKTLELEARSDDFDPVLYVLKDSCDGKASALSCLAGTKGTPLKLSLDAPETGAYYVVVDGVAGSGNYALVARPIAP